MYIEFNIICVHIIINLIYIIFDIAKMNFIAIYSLKLIKVQYNFLKSKYNENIKKNYLISFFKYKFLNKHILFRLSILDIIFWYF